MRERRTSTVLSYGRTDHLVSTASASRQNGRGHSNQPPAEPLSSYRVVQIGSSDDNRLSQLTSENESSGRDSTRPVPSSWRPPPPPLREETRPIPRTIGAATDSTGGISWTINTTPVVSPKSTHVPEPSDQADTQISSTHPPSNEGVPTSPCAQRPSLRVDTTTSTLSITSPSASSRRTGKTKEGREPKPPVYSPGSEPPSYVQAVHQEK